MYTFDFSSISSTIASFFDLVGGILRFDTDAFEAVYTQEGGYIMALAILLLGGISLELGQSVVLFANRVRRRRFVISLLMGSLLLLLGILLWAGSVWLLGLIFLDGTLSFLTVFIGAAMSSAPLLFGFFVLTPYLGIFFFQILRIWVLLLYLVVIDSTTGIGYWWALGLSLVGWVLLELVLRLPALQVDRIRDWYWRLSTGTPHRMEIEDTVQHFLSDLRAAVGMEEEDPEGGGE